MNTFIHYSQLLLNDQTSLIQTFLYDGVEDTREEIASLNETGEYYHDIDEEAMLKSIEDHFRGE